MFLMQMVFKFSKVWITTHFFWEIISHFIGSLCFISENLSRENSLKPRLFEAEEKNNTLWISQTTLGWKYNAFDVNFYCCWIQKTKRDCVLWADEWKGLPASKVFLKECWNVSLWIMRTFANVQSDAISVKLLHIIRKRPISDARNGK